MFIINIIFYIEIKNRNKNSILNSIYNDLNDINKFSCLIFKKNEIFY